MITEDISYINLIIRQELPPAKINNGKKYKHKNDYYNYSLYYEKNKESIKSKRIAHYKNNIEAEREQSNKWYQSNKEKVALARLIWRKKNPSRALAIKAKRRARKLCATPKWAEKEREEIMEIYRIARVERDNGNDVHVDHIIPLANKYVCGLHCLANLRIIPAEENLKKNNLFDPNGID